MSQYIVVTPEGNRFGPTDFQTLAVWAQEGRVAPGMTVEDLLSGQTMTASAVPGLFDPAADRADSNYLRPVSQPKRSAGMAAMVFGLVGLVAWCLPLAGLGIGVTAIVLGIKARNTADRTQALVGVALGIFCILLSIACAVVAALLLSAANSLG